MSKPMKTILGAMAFAVVGSAVAGSHASASRLWDPYLRGVNEGLPAGALPPAGVYGVLDNYFANYAQYNNSANKIPGSNLTALVEVPIVLWVPGITVLGASYAAAIAQPFDYTSFEPTQAGHPGSGNWGTFNTVLIPGQLSWALPNDLFVKTGFEIYVPDASSTYNTLVKGKLNNGGLPSGNGYTAVQPDLAASWLSDGWNLSADLHLAIPVTSDKYAGVTYKSGNEFSADYTVAKTIGKWTFGLGAHQMNQLNADTSNGTSVANSKVTSYGLGPIVGYQFADLGVTAEWDHNIHTANDVAGDIFNFRFVTAF